MYGFEINLKEGKRMKTSTIFPAEFQPDPFCGKIIV
jgi:hypothetical protein